MKYLKTFEKIDFNDIFSLNGSRAKREELKDFCELYLAYLMDDAIKELKVGKPQLLQTEKYVCYNVEIYFNEDVHWNQIKDHFLPFLQMVQKEYVLREDIYGKFCSISWRFVGTKISVPREYTLEELLDDKLETNFSQSIRTFSSDEGFHGEVTGNVMSIKLDILEEVSKD
jgi:hypothetical protein